MPDCRLIIVAEGITDVKILRLLLRNELPAAMRFFAGQGRESLVTLARNLLVHEGDPVLLVMDIATRELASREEILAQVMRALSAVAMPGAFQVFSFTPEIEIAFFEAPAALERVLNTKLTDKVLKEGLANPKPTLQQLLSAASIPSTEALIRRLDEEAIQALSRGKQAMAFRQVVQAFCRLETIEA
jgi:hypothetical protein